MNREPGGQKPHSERVEPSEQARQSEQAKQPESRKNAVSKIAKTLLEQEIPSAGFQSSVAGASAAGSPASGSPSFDSGGPSSSESASGASVGSGSGSGAPAEPRKVKRISRTMLEIDKRGLAAAEKAILDEPGVGSSSHDVTSKGFQPDNAATKSSEGSSGESSNPMSGRYVAKTMLDHSVLLQAVSKSADKMELKAAAIAKERALNPVQPIEPIAADGKVAKCSWSWPDSSNSKERYRACGVCQAAIYDFDGIEREQAAAMVFQRENLKRPKFYLRSDGKFMTRGCPREVARKVQLFSMSALAVVSVLSAILVMILMSQSSQIEPVSSSVSGAGPGVSGGQPLTQPSPSSVSSSASPGSAATAASPSTSAAASSAIPPISASVAPGWVHYENGKITRGPAVGGEPVPARIPASGAASEANEPLWQDTSK